MASVVRSQAAINYVKMMGLKYIPPPASIKSIHLRNFSYLSKALSPQHRADVMLACWVSVACASPIKICQNKQNYAAIVTSQSR